MSIDLTKPIEIEGPTEPLVLEIGLDIGHVTGHHPMFALMRQRATKEEAIEYRQLFEQAPRIKREHGEMLVVLKKLIERVPGFMNIQGSAELQMAVSDAIRIVREIEA